MAGRQTGGRCAPLRHISGPLDITFQRLPRPDAEYVARGRGRTRSDRAGPPGERARDLAEGLSRLLRRRERRDLRWALLAAGLPGTVFAFYLRSVIPGLIPCFASGFAEAGEPPRYTEFAVLHDFMHDLGIVGPCSPHFWDAGTSTRTPTTSCGRERDPGRRSILDVGRDDYFQAHIAGCPDLDTSGFLTSDATSPSPSPRSDPGQARSPAAPGALVDCGSTCSAPYGRGTVVALTARPEGKSTFVGWGAPCAGTGPCSVTVDAAKTGHGPVQGSGREVVVETLGSGRNGHERARGVCAVRPPAPRPSRAIPARAQGERAARVAVLRLGPGLLGADVLVHARSDKYVLAMFADVQAPRVRALEPRGRGGLARLPLRVSENMGTARVTIRVAGRVTLRKPFAA